MTGTRLPVELLPDPKTNTTDSVSRARESVSGQRSLLEPPAESTVTVYFQMLKLSSYKPSKGTIGNNYVCIW